jgi:molecular chaperone GrpE
MEDNLNKQNGSAEENENKIPIERVEVNAAKNEDQSVELESKEAELKKSLEKISELEKQINELKDTLLRKAAEFENYKRRSENDQLNIIKYAAESFIRSILPVYDDFERSMAHIDDENNFESTKKGLLLLFDKFGKILDSQGIKKIDAKGKPFDVHYHEALMQQPVEGVAPHTVLDVIEAGYIYKDKVIRHAKVIVSADSTTHEGGTGNQNDENNEGQQ